MTSILTNAAALSALSSLNNTQLQLSKTQAQISSGLAVANSSDNAAYWSIGQTMSAQAAGLKAVNQGLSLTMSIANVTADALVSIKSSLDRIQRDVVASGQSGMDLSAVQSDISAQQQSILAIANSASFNGVNWLINRTSTSDSYTVVGTSSVSLADLGSIALNQDPGATSVYHSIQTETHSTSEGGLSASTTTIKDTTVTKIDNSDGTFYAPPPVVTETTSSSSDGLNVGRAVIPMSVSASGLITSSFSLAPLALFSDNTGTTTTSTTVSYPGAPPITTTESSSYTINTNSYDGYSISAPGILDETIALTRVGPVTAASQSTQPPSQQFVFDPATGGNVLQISPGPSNGSSATTQFIQESILTLSVVGTSAADRALMGQAIQSSIRGLITASTAVGALQNQISNQQLFNSSLSDALTSGVGSLVDADMNVASTRLQALQTQQQLGIQALSMANNNSQLILKLFQAA